MLWVKAFHIIFVASWFAGLFYLPRIFVNLAMVTPGSVSERERLIGMAQRLLRFTTILAVPALGLVASQKSRRSWLSGFLTFRAKSRRLRFRWV